MAQQTINIGSVANDGTGDPIRDAFAKVNENFTELYQDDAGDVNSVSAGTGITVNQTTGAVTVTNSAPDKTVVLTGGSNVTVTGTYPNFTIAADTTIGDDTVTFDKLAPEFKLTAPLPPGNITMDFSQFDTFIATATDTVLNSISPINFENGMCKNLILSGDNPISFTNGKLIAGTYDGTVSNFIQMVVTNAGIYYSISQEQI
jgi:hypothetical protein